MEKQRGRTFGFRKTPTAVKKNPYRQIDQAMCVQVSFSRNLKFTAWRVSKIVISERPGPSTRAVMCKTGSPQQLQRDLTGL
jgi:hypothetical protein